jgi:uncharacterized protein (DUF2141 family)
MESRLTIEDYLAALCYALWGLSQRTVQLDRRRQGQLLCELFQSQQHFTSHQQKIITNYIIEHTFDK